MAIAGKPEIPSPLAAPSPIAAVPGPVLDGGSKWSKRAAKAFLESCPKRWVTIERTSDDIAFETKQGSPAHQYVGWNGWAWPVPKGVPVEVPEPIALILDQARELFRTDQARERRAFFNSIADDSLGVEISL
jgi:hypothetical protein